MRPLRDRVAIDDSEFRYFGSSPICDECRHRIGFPDLACAAFPDRIPKEIWNGERDHRAPYPGDGGIRFAAMRPEDHERQRRIEEERHAWVLALKERLIAEGRLHPKTTEEPVPAEPATTRAAG